MSCNYGAYVLYQGLSHYLTLLNWHPSSLGGSLSPTAGDSHLAKYCFFRTAAQTSISNVHLYFWPKLSNLMSAHLVQSRI
jgi:hypothetical protein